MTGPNKGPLTFLPSLEFLPDAGEATGVDQTEVGICGHGVRDIDEIVLLEETGEQFPISAVAHPEGDL